MDRHPHPPLKRISVLLGCWEPEGSTGLSVWSCNLSTHADPPHSHPLNPSDQTRAQRFFWAQPKLVIYCPYRHKHVLYAFQHHFEIFYLHKDVHEHECLYRGDSYWLLDQLYVVFFVWFYWFIYINALQMYFIHTMAWKHLLCDNIFQFWIQINVKIKSVLHRHTIYNYTYIYIYLLLVW